jgi:hypothetical protein
MTNNAYMHSHSGGLNRVPYDGYIARLHKDERVVTAGDNKGGGSGVVVSGNTFIVRQESDIHAIAYELAKLIEREGAQMA